MATAEAWMEKQIDRVNIDLTVSLKKLLKALHELTVNATKKDFGRNHTRVNAKKWRLPSGHNLNRYRTNTMRE